MPSDLIFTDFGKGPEHQFGKIKAYTQTPSQNIKYDKMFYGAEQSENWDYSWHMVEAFENISRGVPGAPALKSPFALNGQAMPKVFWDQCQRWIQLVPTEIKSNPPPTVSKGV